MPNKSWYKESTEQSEVKRQIVSKYFWAWATAIIPTAKKWSNKIAYIDLFAGPGRYEDGTKSTPLIILKKAIQNEDMSKMLVTLFNDVDTNNTKSLEKAIEELPDIKALKYKPIVMNNEVGIEIVKMFEKMKLIPTLFFVDPWGYKGLSLRLINSVLKNWGCDCIFFFNYNRINMGMNNKMVKEHMDALFGEEKAEILRKKLKSLKPNERELAIIEEIAEALKEMGGKYVLPFRFKNNRGKRTSHHLIFVSKNILGYKMMKDIMAKYSSLHEQGVPTFEYSIADYRFPLLFELSRPLDDLYDMLLNDFAGQTLKHVDIFRKHNIGKRYVERNYREILIKLEADGKIITDPSANKRRKRKGEVTFGKNVEVTFPGKGK